MGMYNLLTVVELVCPRCQKLILAQAEFKLGFLKLANYKLGDYLEWDANNKGLQLPKSRPTDGNIEGEAYVECAECHKDFWLQVSVQGDRIITVQVNPDRKGYIA